MSLKREIKDLVLLKEEKQREIAEIEAKIKFRRAQQLHADRMSKIEDRLIVVENIDSKHVVNEFFKNAPNDFTKEAIETPAKERITKKIERKGLKITCTLTFHDYNECVVATAKCNPSDKFDLQRGVEIAEARAYLKFYQQYVAKLVK